MGCGITHEKKKRKHNKKEHEHSGSYEYSKAGEVVVGSNQDDIGNVDPISNKHPKHMTEEEYKQTLDIRAAAVEKRLKEQQTRNIKPSSLVRKLNCIK
jgi:hypothetical protein